MRGKHNGTSEEDAEVCLSVKKLKSNLQIEFRKVVAKDVWSSVAYYYPLPTDPAQYRASRAHALWRGGKKDVH